LYARRLVGSMSNARTYIHTQRERERERKQAGKQSYYIFECIPPYLLTYLPPLL
jgi:hypothetical protein